MDGSYGVLHPASMSSELLSLVGGGRVYSLAHPISEETPFADTTSAFARRLRRTHADPFDEGPFREAAEILEMSCHMATHIEGLCHIAEVVDGEPLLYGGTPSGHALNGAAFTELGIEQCPPVVSRGILLDVASHLGVDVLPDSYGVTITDITGCLNASGLDIQSGDTVLIRTGFSKLRALGRERFQTVGPGPTPEACRWLADREIGLTGSDTMSFEQVPSPHIGHLELIRRRGISIIKQANLEDLARDSVSEFLFVALPLKLIGATASPVNPIAVA